MVQSFLRRLLASLRPGKSERRLNEEFQEHLHALAARQSEQGLRPDDALKRHAGISDPLNRRKNGTATKLAFRALKIWGATSDSRFGSAAKIPALRRRQCFLSHSGSEQTPLCFRSSTLFC